MSRISSRIAADSSHARRSPSAPQKPAALCQKRRNSRRRRRLSVSPLSGSRLMMVSSSSAAGDGGAPCCFLLIIASHPLQGLNGRRAPAAQSPAAQGGNDLWSMWVRRRLPEAGAPYGTRTRVTAVKGRRPRPLDEGRPKARRHIEAFAGGGKEGRAKPRTATATRAALTTSRYSASMPTAPSAAAAHPSAAARSSACRVSARTPSLRRAAAG